MFRNAKFLLFVFILLTSFTAMGQKVRLKQAKTFYGGTLNGESYQSFAGNVIFIQKETTISTDSAVQYRKSNVVEAFGNVKIVDETAIITSRRLIFEGDRELAKLRQNVVYRQKEGMSLYTDNLDYDMKQKVATYFNGGRLVDSTSVLTSKRGNFNDATGIATFYEEVVAVFPDFTLRSSALKYNTSTGVVYFIAPTTLTDKDGNVANYTEGEYNTRSKSSELRQGTIKSADYTVKASRLYSNELEGTSRATGNVVLTATNDDLIIYGDEAVFNENTGISKVYGAPLMKKPFNGDTLYLSADTLISIDSEIESEKRLLAYNNVKIYKNDLQAVADSLIYLQSDSIIRFFKNPVLWSNKSQMTADTISIIIANNTIDRMEMDFNSFVISQDTLENFNQVKGRKMISYFVEGDISKVTVDGNCESIFFALDEKEEFVTGMNKIICSNMVIQFENNTAHKISALQKPDASFIPPHELEVEEKTLRGFEWKEEQKPTLRDVLSQNLDKSSIKLPEKKIGGPTPANEKTPKRQVKKGKANN